MGSIRDFALRVLLGLVLACFVSPLAWAQEAFYKGKRLTVLVNYAAGGPTDVEARLFAKFLVRYLEGEPNVIVQNMDGAGGLIGANYLGEIAPRDGTTIGYFSGAAWQSASDPRARKIDFRSYEFVSYQPGTSIYFVRADVAPGMKTATDIGRAQGLISGGVGVDNAKDILLRLTADMLGVASKHVTGYKGSQGARLALQQGEINYYSEGPAAYRSVIEPSVIAKKEAIPIFYDPAYNGVSFRASRQMEGLDILPFQELYKKIKGVEPSGDLWKAYLSIIALSGSMQRLIVMPPGAPTAGVEAVRRALDRMVSDKIFQEECTALGFLPEFVTEDGVNDQVRKALTVSPDMKKFIHDYAQTR